MQRNARKAFNQLQHQGFPVIDHGDRDAQWGAHFILSAERYRTDDPVAGDYFGDEVRELEDGAGVPHHMFNIRDEVHDILDRQGLRTEWIDPGTIGIYDD